jgi:hypothetical protein
MLWSCISIQKLGVVWQVKSVALMAKVAGSRGRKERGATYRLSWPVNRAGVRWFDILSASERLRDRRPGPLYLNCNEKHTA